MKRILFPIVIAVLTLASGQALAQGGIPQVPLNASNTGTTYNVPTDGIYLTDDNSGTSGAYSANISYYITLQGSCVLPNRLSLTFETFDIAPQDTLYIYDGASTSSPIIYASNNNTDNLLGQQVYTSNLNTSNSLTVKLVTHTSSGRGFQALVSCKFPCERVTPVIDDFYFKVINGQPSTDTSWVRTFVDTTTVIDSLRIVDIDSSGNPIYDTVWKTQVSYTPGFPICAGEEILLSGHGVYTHNNGAYNPMDLTSVFNWNFGNGDTLVDLGATQVIATYNDLDCYNIILSITDEMGCKSTEYEMVQVRIAQNPIKTLYDLATICNSDSLLVNVGYEGENGTITLKKIEFAQTKTRINNVRTFIPDGGDCSETGSPCYSANVYFDDFPSGRSVTSKEDICSICMNCEHSFMGDCTYAIICPNGSKAMLKYKSDQPGAGTGNLTDDIIPYNGGGGSIFLGIPMGGSSDGSWDVTGAQLCDSLANPYGVGWTYCFSRNATYEYRTFGGNKTGIACGSSENMVSVAYTFPPIPAPFYKAGQTPGAVTCNSRDSSDHDNKSGYYLSADNFSTLVGCPLNGTWSLEFCDTWGQDNGWIFNFSIDICGISSGGGCEYQVGLDSIIWRPDSSYGDFLTGKYRGAVIWQYDSVNSYIASPDTAGYFGLHVTIYDEFGCVWDTLTHITTVWTPTPDLGNDTILCSVETMTIDARDAHTATTNQTFMWEPYGDTTSVIESHTAVGSSTLYLVEVTNEQSNIRCRNRDSIRISVKPTPVPNFDPGVYPLEGCEPFTLTFNNTSTNGDTYLWVFGDGDSSTLESPTHTYAAGHYDFKYYMENDGGCKDSLVYKSLITVFSSPVAKFSWDPINPTVLNPTVQFTNRTEPLADTNKYYWEIQYNRDNPNSYHTMTDVNPSFTWETNGEDISGTYIARLIAKTNNYGPSGQMQECRDTVENYILLVNDFLQFPNVITANGDGINDVFEIKNLVNGMGYPNNSLAIYNRWGKRVYYKENISSDDDWWDPAKDNIPSGTYFWRFTGKGYLGDVQRTGTVEVLK